MLHDSPGRRDFLKLVGLAGLSTTLGAPARAVAQAAKTMTAPADTAKAGMKAAAADTSKTTAPAAPSEDARALAAIIQRRYGQHLDADQMKGVTEEIDSRLGSGQRLRSSKLANGDEPDVTFHA